MNMSMSTMSWLVVDDRSVIVSRNEKKNYDMNNIIKKIIYYIIKHLNKNIIMMC